MVIARVTGAVTALVSVSDSKIALQITRNRDVIYMIRCGFMATGALNDKSELYTVKYLHGDTLVHEIVAVISNKGGK